MSHSGPIQIPDFRRACNAGGSEFRTRVAGDGSGWMQKPAGAALTANQELFAA
jgi:hypothetical protein